MRKKSCVFCFVLALIIGMLIPWENGYASTSKISKRKIYPEVDTKYDNYKYVTDFPEIIMSTDGTDNGLTGKCYKITGTVKGVYSSMNKAIKALGKKEAIKDSASDIKEKCIIVKTAKGNVLVQDSYSAFYNEIKEILGEEFVNDYYNEKGYGFKKYKQYPIKGEKVTILATYLGYSSVAGIPVFNYGISPEVVLMTKGNDKNSDDTSKKVETLSYKYNSISFEYPKSWDYIKVNETNNDLVYFYPNAGDDGVMMLYNSYNSYGRMYQFEADELVESMGETFDDFKVIASKKNEYKGKKIDTYYIYSFKCSVNKQKCKGRITFFTYKYQDYMFLYVCPVDSSKMDSLFDDYKKIVKSVKAK